MVEDQWSDYWFGKQGLTYGHQMQNWIFNIRFTTWYVNLKQSCQTEDVVID
ncbi:hypothetical protein Scep_022286 [Stephania cephalantha]|uniref:Uncharacterized protein n=1 Tax=Stephania cephalantha TaxID=152367 RepID=A0AAP0F7R5_9MAGN